MQATLPLRAFLLFFGLLLPFLTIAQDRCGTVDYDQQRGVSPDAKELFENWLRINQRNSNRTLRKQSGPYKIPIVVHVIHNGEPIGTGTNISDAQVISQIDVLNKDFRRLNSDASNTPAQFVALAGAMDIEFTLAKQDPEGLPTTGIVRVNGQRTSWQLADNYQLKSKSYWPSEDYCNVWVCNITDFLGYTQFPVSNLPGLENGSNNASTDGIVIWHKAFGSINDGPFSLDPKYNLGRTLTHEMGHFFGLRHIAGDDSGSCSGTDYVNDTPNQASQTTGCPSHPRTDNCTTAKMFQNFLDYTDDNCMNLFTQEQVSRMDVVVETSPRRVSLLTSHGLSDPVPVANDIGIREIISPQASSCGSLVPPVIEVKNYGSNHIGSARISFVVNGIEKERKDFSLDLDYLETALVSFNAVNFTPGSSTVSFVVILTNGVADGGSYNNDVDASVFVPETTTAPFSENFNSIPPQWVIQNPDGQTTWELATAPKDGPDNKALLVKFYDYEDNLGELDVFLSPVFDLTSVPAASLRFDVSYARYQSSNDGLKVIVLTDCETLANGTTVYEKTGATLSTAPATTQNFVPSGPTQWRNEVINLSPFIGQSNVQLAFVSVNDWGNNLYIDNVSVTTALLEDVSLKQLSEPSPVTCADGITPVIIVQNLGTVSIESFEVNYRINGGTMQTESFTALGLSSGQETLITLPAVGLADGENTLSIDIVNPNGKVDETPANNYKEFTIFLNTAADLIPLRENFDSDFDDAWTTVNPTGGMNWESIPTNFGTSLYFNAYNNTTLADQAWLVSPVLDLSKSSVANLVFDLSYALRAAKSEKLRVMASIDCGNTFTMAWEIDLSGFDAATVPWNPGGAEHWHQEVVNLNNFAGEQQVRVAFVVTNDNGNNVFLDNIEFFVTNNPTSVQIQTPYSIYGYSAEVPSDSELKITFNLAERQPVQYSIIDMMGKTLVDGVLKDVLNQTYPLGLEQNLASGVYIVKLWMDGRYYTERILVSR